MIARLVNTLGGVCVVRLSITMLDTGSYSVSVGRVIANLTSLRVELLDPDEVLAVLFPD